MTLSPILPTHAATTVALDFGVFIAEQARTYRVSQSAIIAALRPFLDRKPADGVGSSEVTTSEPSISAPENILDRVLITTPSQPEAPSKPHAPAADTPATQAAGDTTGAEASSSLASAPVENSVAGNPVTLIPEAPKPLPDDEEMRRPVEAKTLEQEASADASGGMQDESAIHPAAPSPRMTKREQVRECHEQHPDWTSHQIAEHLGFGVQHIQVMASHLSLKLPRAPRTPPENMRDKVLAVVAAHPDWTLRQIAAEAGCSLGTASKWAKEAAEKPPEAEAPTDEPQAMAEPERLPASTKTEPALPLPPPIVRPVRTTPTGRFYLREKAELGKPVRYVHQSLSPCPTGPGPLMTLDRKWAWFDTMDRYRGALKQWPQITSMLKEAASK